MSFFSRTLPFILIGSLIATTISACAPSKTVTVIATPSPSSARPTTTTQPPTSTVPPTVPSGASAHSLSYTYQIDLSGPEMVKNSAQQTLPVSAGKSCTNPGMNFLQTIPDEGRIYHAISGNFSITPLPVGDSPLGIVDGSQFILTTAVGDDIYGPTQAVEGNLTINADGSGRYEFDQWEDSIGDHESGTIDWTCTR